MSQDRYLQTTVVALLIVLRVLIGYQPHSGQDNYHGSKATYGGDFEAQRHWMELTLHLPLKEWYWYDLEYWGLDYPPLSAYQSLLCGYLSEIFVGSESVALFTSRGYEDPVHKAYMRATVIVLDLLIYGTATWYATKSLTDDPKQRLFHYVIAMTQPALLLIDHGHFQYNAVSLGLAIWAFYFCSKPSFVYCVIGSIFFCLALSFKQMTLYYAPAIFAYLLVTVIIVLSLMFAPFVIFGPEDTSAIQRLVHVLRRIIPIQRGLFESKVANLWLVMSLKPFRIRQRLSATLQPIMALLLTLALSIPACYKLFELGRQYTSASMSRDQFKGLLWGSTCVSLSFFLASFQVHEKSLLIVLAPFSLLVIDQFSRVRWFSILVTWTLWPLLVLDRLQIAYACTLVIHGGILVVYSDTIPQMRNKRKYTYLFKAFEVLSYSGMAVLHVAEMLIQPPPSLPDIFPVLWSVYGCGMLCITWLILHVEALRVSERPHQKTE